MIKLPDDLNDKSFHFIAEKFQCSTLQAQFILVGINYTTAEVQRLNATAQPVSDGWVKCSDRMPPDESWVLVTNGRHVGTGAYLRDEHLEEDERWQDEHFEFINLQSKYPITHWMPLPAAPGGQGNEQ